MPLGKKLEDLWNYLLFVSATIVFQALRVAPHGNLSTGERVLYTSVTKNEGAGYDGTTSTITAPVAGLYAFAKQTCTLRTKSAISTFMLNGVRILDSQTTASIDENACASGQLFLQMKKGDRLWVDVPAPFSGSYVLSAPLHQSNFAGAFIHP